MGSVVITGSSGFLGRNIARALRDAGYDPVGIDRAPDHPEAGLIEHHKLELPNARIVEILRRLQPVAIVHAGAPSSVPASVADPVADFHGALDSLVSLLDTMRRVSPGTRMILLSSAAVYGNPETLPIVEDSACKPVSPYGYNKLLSEKVMEEFATVFGTPGCALRIFSAYGPGLRRQILWDICKKARSGRVDLFGTGQETRDFVHARDVAAAVVVVAKGASFEAEVYNVASGTETTIAETADVLLDALHLNLPVTFSGDTRVGDPVNWRADITRLRRLGYFPSVLIKDGIREFGEWALNQPLN